MNVTVANDEEAFLRADRPLVDVVDRLLEHGVAIRGEVWLTVADIDLAFVGLDLVLANPDTMQGRRPDQ
ncbi:MAG: gas vesicle protein [Pseudomonadota bacterium]